jgi:hypothetical protein
MSSRSSYVLSLTALFVAVLGWTPVGDAARHAVFPADSVGTTQLRTNAVTSPKIRNGSVTAIDIQKAAITAVHVKPGGLLASNFKAGQLPAGPKGDKGDKGDKGVKGDKGAQGNPGITKYAIVEKTSSATTGSLGVFVACPDGSRPLGGGGFTQSPGAGVTVQNSFPVLGATPGWFVVARATTPGAGWSYKAMAVCAIVSAT